jgi:hypothetical protein
MLPRDGGVNWALTRNICFCRSLAVSTAFGVNCACLETWMILAGEGVCGHGIKHHAYLLPEPHFASEFGWQEEMHVHVRQGRPG